MEDVKENFIKNICIFCDKKQCQNYMNIQEKRANNLTIYKCLNYKKERKMIKEFEEYIRYTYCDEVGLSVAIIKRETPKDIVREIRKKYNIVKYTEQYNNGKMQN